MGRKILGKAKKKTLSVSGRKCRESYYKKIERVLRESNPRLKNRNLT